jgi:hypothetical protein
MAERKSPCDAASSPAIGGANTVETLLSISAALRVVD